MAKLIKKNIKNVKKLEKHATKLGVGCLEAMEFPCDLYMGKEVAYCVPAGFKGVPEGKVPCYLDTVIGRFLELIREGTVEQVHEMKADSGITSHPMDSLMDALENEDFQWIGTTMVLYAPEEGREMFCEIAKTVLVTGYQVCSKLVDKDSFSSFVSACTSMGQDTIKVLTDEEVPLDNLLPPTEGEVYTVTMYNEKFIITDIEE